VLSFSLSSHAFAEADVKPFQDFFRKKLEKPKPVVSVQAVKRPPISEPTRAIPPLQVGLLGIAGEEGAHVAIISYKGKQLLLEEGDEVRGEFKVIRIHEDKITFFHIKANTRQEVLF
ncbi:hypothetical protein HOF92_00585, partial [bacterium]|nr:hypothetical protein [bacterium]